MFFRNVHNDLQDSTVVILQKTVIFTNYVVQFIAWNQDLLFFLSGFLPVIGDCQLLQGERGGGK
jgi:hypothetical protein